VVLESLSRSPLRRREPAVLFLVLGRVGQGMELVGEVFATPGNSRLRQPRRRSLRLAPPDRVRRPRHSGNFRRRYRYLVDRNKPRRPSRRKVLHYGGRLSVGTEPPGVPRHGRFPRAHLSHRRMAARGRRLQRHAGWFHRHRLIRRPVDTDYRAAGITIDRVSAHRNLVGTSVERGAVGGISERSQGKLSGIAREGARTSDGFLFPVQYRTGPAGERGGATATIRGGVAARRAPLSWCLWRPPVRKIGERYDRRIRTAEDPQRRQGSRDGRVAVPAKC